MPGKKWCEYCRINLPYTKKDIQDHESTRNHLQNKQKAIKYQRIKVRKQRNQKKAEVMLGTANIPKAKRGSQLDKQVQAYRDSVIQQGKSDIHKLISQKTKGFFGAPIQYPDKQDLVLAQNYENDDNELDSDAGDSQHGQKSYQMWKIDICQQTGDACFINKITKAKLYEHPKGYVLSQEQKQQWAYITQLCKDKIDYNPDATVNISQWEEVAEDEDYFQINKAEDSNNSEDSDDQDHLDDKNNNSHHKNKNLINVVDYQKYIKKQQQEEEEEDIKKQQPQKNAIPTNTLEDRLDRGDITTNEVFHQFIETKMNECKTIKQKNQNLKKMIENGIDIRSRPSDQIMKAIDPTVGSRITGFKPRKKVQTTSSVQLTSQKDFY